MTRTVFCRRLKKEMPGLDQPPFPGPRGQDIFEHVCLESWEAWRAHQTMLINERNLNLMDKGARKFLNEEMDRFLAGDELTRIQGYVPVKPPE